MSGFCTQFVDSNFELGSNYSDVIAPQDVATYGGLCALASFDRAELKVRKKNQYLHRLTGTLSAAFNSLTLSKGGIGDHMIYYFLYSLPNFPKFGRMTASLGT